jgi:hypothetical protein
MGRVPHVLSHEGGVQATQLNEVMRVLSVGVSETLAGGPCISVGSGMDGRDVLLTLAPAVGWSAVIEPLYGRTETGSRGRGKKHYSQGAAPCKH